MSLYHELKRRNVFRVVIAYLAGSWLLVEVAETVFPLFGFDDTPARIVVILLAIGFPILLVISWVFELTPEGLKLEKNIDPSESVTHHTSKKLDRVIIVLLALALGYFAFDKFVLDPARDREIAQTAAQAGAEQALAGAKETTFLDKSIAVLPFVNMSADPEQEYFSDGLSDTLIHVLAQVSGLKVTAKTSSFYFKGKNMEVGEIARELHVGTLLVGSVQKSGDRVRVIAQLINAADSTHRWSKSFDHDLGDIFAVQDEIAQEVVKSLKVTLLDSELERLEQRYKPMVEAYEQVIMGRHEMGKHTAASLAAAERHFKRAIELDPGYSLAYVGLADTYGHQVFYGSLVFEQSLQRRQPLVDKALELDPLSGEAYRARASLNIDWQIKTSEENFSAVEGDILKAIQLSPNDAAAYHWHSGLLSGKELFEEALVQVRMAAELDPISPIIQLDVARATWDVGRAEEALMLIRQNIARTPKFLDNYETMAQYQSQLGQLGEAQWWFREARKMNPEGAYTWNRECLGLLALGDAQSAEDCIKQLIEAHPDNPFSLIMRLLLHAYLGEWDAAKAILELLWERLPGWHPYTRILAFLTAMQGDLERARILMAESFPWMLEDGLELAASDLNSAIVFAAILNATGEIQRRDVLLSALEARIATMHRTRGTSYGILDVYIHAMRGDRDRAIAALRDAIEIGWRISWSHLDSSWWLLQDDWRLADLQQDPEFIAMVNELEADIDAQRQWYEENKDKPLF